MAEATETLDLSGVLDVLRIYHRIAVQTRHDCQVAHRRMPAEARDISPPGATRRRSTSPSTAPTLTGGSD